MHTQFQRGKSKGINATYHFSFYGSETRKGTVGISDQMLEVHDGHIGSANLRVLADRLTWLGFLPRERILAWALLSRRIRLRGSPHWLLRFGKCFPS